MDNKCGKKIKQPPILPLKYHKQSSRPKTAQRREVDEVTRDANKLRRLFHMIICKKCGPKSHNSRTDYMKEVGEARPSILNPIRQQ